MSQNKPERGYGYIECVDEIIDSQKVSQIKNIYRKAIKKIA